MADLSDDDIETLREEHGVGWTGDFYRCGAPELGNFARAVARLAADRALNAPQAAAWQAVPGEKCAYPMSDPKFKIGDRVRKVKGSQWTGTVVGTYSTALTPDGYAVESDTERGSVQIYPAAALEAAPSPSVGADGLPTVPDAVLAYIHAYGDSRADDDGISGLRIAEAILAIRSWAAVLASRPVGDGGADTLLPPMSAADRPEQYERFRTWVRPFSWSGNQAAMDLAWMTWCAARTAGTAEDTPA